jgi:hypothetical protein
LTKIPQSMPRSMADFAAYGVAYGVLADIEGPDGFVYKGKLYVCGDKNAGENFRTDLDNNIEKADTNWQKLSGVLVSALLVNIIAPAPC